jgi:hypothetical protein
MKVKFQVLTAAIMTVLGETGWDGWKDGFWLLYRLYGQVPVHYDLLGCCAV